MKAENKKLLDSSPSTFANTNGEILSATSTLTVNVNNGIRKERTSVPIKKKRLKKCMFSFSKNNL